MRALLVLGFFAILGSACAPTTGVSVPSVAADGVAETHAPGVRAFGAIAPGAHTATTGATSGLSMPVEGVRVRDVASNFGAKRGHRTHEGMDIFAPAGTPVYSAGAGTVYFLGRTERGGWTVWIEDGPWDFWYTHLSGIAPHLSKHSRVDSSTLIGWVGNTGNASGGPPHLHFEVVTARGPIDPLPHLVDRPEPSTTEK